MRSFFKPNGEQSLVPGEKIIKQMRPHWALLFKPVAGAILLSGALWLSLKGMHLVYPNHSGKIDTGFLVVYLLFLFPWVIVPFLKWATTMYLFTDQRIITRTGLLRISGESISLSKVNSVQFTKSLLERLYGSGSLIIESAAENAVVIKHVRGAENIQREIYVLMGRIDENGQVIEVAPPVKKAPKRDKNKPI